MVPENCADIYVKLEYFNPTGSYKDRMALAIIEEGEKRGDINKQSFIVEYTAGSTGNLQMNAKRCLMKWLNNSL